MTSTERAGYTSSRTASTFYDDDDDDDDDEEERGSTIHRLTAIDELYAVGGGGGRGASNLWERFDDHIRCIAAADPKEQYHKKMSMDKASETYMAALREFYYEDSDNEEEEEEEDFSDSEDEELKVVVAAANDNDDNDNNDNDNNDAFKDEQVMGLPRNTPVETTSKRNWTGGQDGELTCDNGEENNSPLRDSPNTYCGHHQSKQQQQQQQQTDEDAVKRMALYEKYLERDNAWADGLTKCGKEILMEIQKRKKRPKRFVVFSTSLGNSRSSEMKSASRSKRSISYNL